VSNGEGSLRSSLANAGVFPNPAVVARAEFGLDPIVSCGPEGPEFPLSQVLAGACNPFVGPGKQADGTVELNPTPTGDSQMSVASDFGPGFGGPDLGDIEIPTFQQTDEPLFGPQQPTFEEFGQNLATQERRDQAQQANRDAAAAQDRRTASGVGNEGTISNSAADDDGGFFGDFIDILLRGAQAVFDAVVNAPADIIRIAAAAFGRELTAAEARAVSAALQQDPERLSRELARIAAERMNLTQEEEAEAAARAGGQGDGMADDPFTELMQNIAGCDKRFFRPAPDRVRAVPLLCVDRPDGGSEFYINIKLNRSKLIRMEANKGRRRRKNC